MALKKKPVTGMKDMMPREMEIRDYVIQLIKDTYKTYGFSSIFLKITLSFPLLFIVSNPCAVIFNGSVIAVPTLASP